jgi:hypothetical protein
VRVSAVETAAAMVVTAAAGVALGLASSLALAWGTDAHWAWPDPVTLTMIGAGVLAALVLTGDEVGPLVAATFTFQDGRFFVDDVTVAPWLLALVLAGVPMLAALTTVATLRRVHDALCPPIR